MAQQHPIQEGIRQLQDDVERLEALSGNDNRPPISSTKADTLSEDHLVGCQCPKHRLTEHALSELGRLSNRKTYTDGVRQQQEDVAQAVHRGLEKLGIELSKFDADRIANNNAGLMPMEKFLEETWDYKYVAGVNANAGGQDGNNGAEKKE